MKSSPRDPFRDAFVINVANERIQLLGTPPPVDSLRIAAFEVNHGCSEPEWPTDAIAVRGYMRSRYTWVYFFDNVDEYRRFRKDTFAILGGTVQRISPKKVDFEISRDLGTFTLRRSYESATDIQTGELLEAGYFFGHSRSRDYGVKRKDHYLSGVALSLEDILGVSDTYPFSHFIELSSEKVLDSLPYTDRRPAVICSTKSSQLGVLYFFKTPSEALAFKLTHGDHI